MFKHTSNFSPIILPENSISKKQKQSTACASVSHRRLPVHCQTKEKHTSSHNRFQSLSFFVFGYLSPVISVSVVDRNCSSLCVSSFPSAVLSATFSNHPVATLVTVLLLVAVFACSLISATVWPLVEDAAKGTENSQIIITEEKVGEVVHWRISGHLLLQ